MCRIQLPCETCPLAMRGCTMEPFNEGCTQQRKDAIHEFAVEEQSFTLTGLNCTLSRCYKEYLHKFMRHPRYAKVPAWIVSELEFISSQTNPEIQLTTFGLLYMDLWLLPTMSIETIDQIEVF